MVVVAPHGRAFQLVADDADALGGRGVVAHDVAHRDEMRGAERPRVVQYDVQRIDVGVDVAQYGVDAIHCRFNMIAVATCRSACPVVILRFGASHS